MNLPIVSYYPTYSGALERVEPKPNTLSTHCKHEQCDIACDILIFKPFYYFFGVLNVLHRDMNNLMTNLIKYSIISPKPAHQQANVKS